MKLLLSLTVVVMPPLLILTTLAKACTSALTPLAKPLATHQSIHAAAAKGFTLKIYFIRFSLLRLVCAAGHNLSYR